MLTRFRISSTQKLQEKKQVQVRNEKIISSQILLCTSYSAVQCFCLYCCVVPVRRSPGLICYRDASIFLRLCVSFSKVTMQTTIRSRRRHPRRGRGTCPVVDVVVVVWHRCDKNLPSNHRGLKVWGGRATNRRRTTNLLVAPFENRLIFFVRVFQSHLHSRTQAN